MNIPAEAVEAAMSAWGVRGDDQRRIVECILEAAAPYLTQRAYNAGHLDGMTGAPNKNPHRSQA